jgi:hypothetical protein
MKEPIKAYPLCWPAGWRRAPKSERKRGRFTHYGERLYAPEAIERLLYQLKQLGVDADDPVISTNVRALEMHKARISGLADPGVAVYWRDGKNTRCMAIDCYDELVDNIAAAAATLEALRSVERHGGAAILDRAFAGFVALPAPEQWFTILGVSANATEDEIKLAHRRLVAAHPEFRTGGAARELARINAARDEGMSRAKS